MSQKPGSKQPDPHYEAFKAFMDEFVSETDRAAVVLGAAKIDALLCSILDRYLLPHPGSEDDLLEGDSPLATFSSRIKICYRLGLIDQHFAKLLHVFRRLRNAFAHEVAHSSLSSGPARDRVLVMAEPFTKSAYYQGLLESTAVRMKRRVEDPGVMFRTVLAIFYMKLNDIYQVLEPMKPASTHGIVETAANAPFAKSDAT